MKCDRNLIWMLPIVTLSMVDMAQRKGAAPMCSGVENVRLRQEGNQLRNQALGDKHLVMRKYSHHIIWGHSLGWCTSSLPGSNEWAFCDCPVTSCLHCYDEVVEEYACKRSFSSQGRTRDASVIGGSSNLDFVEDRKSTDSDECDG